MKKIFVTVLLGLCVWMMVSAQESEKEYELGLYYYYKKDDPVKAVPYFQRAAEAGLSKAQVELGYMYQSGIGVPKNYQKAMELYRKAEENHDPLGILYIGRLYKEGLGVEQNMQTAFSYYKRAADIGYTLAESITGQCYLYGKGVEKNVPEALKYLERSASKGYDNELLGNLYYEGNEVPRDLKKAYHWFSMGDVKTYNAKSRFQLAYIYYKLFEDYDKALELFYQLHQEEYLGAFETYQEVLQAKEESKLPDTPPSFPGGEGAWEQFISKNMKYPKKAARNGEQGKVVLMATVKKDGKLGNIRVEHGISPELDKEAVRLLLVMPKWNPGSRNGKPMDVEITQTITFSLD